MSRTAPLTSKHCILYIYSTNIGTEYLKHALYSPFFSLENAVCFIILNSLVPVLFKFYIQDVMKLKKNSSGVKGLSCVVNSTYPAQISRTLHHHTPSSEYDNKQRVPAHRTVRHHTKRDYPTVFPSIFHLQNFNTFIKFNLLSFIYFKLCMY